MWRLTSYQLVMDADYFRAQKFSSFALLKYNPEIYPDEFESSVVGIPDRQIICKANRQHNHTASGIVSNEKVMKAARD